jgi:hypothetical protein
MQHLFMRSLPVAHLERFEDSFSIKGAINPDRTLAMPMFPTFGFVLTVFPVAAKYD